MILCLPFACILYVSQVRIELYESGSLAAYALFDAHGADRWSWFSVDRLLSSSWMDIKDYATSNTPLASVDGVHQ